MTANELRIGNWVFAPNGEITKIGYEVIRSLLVFVPKPNYQPIPLTEEWLVRFGFDVGKGSTIWATRKELNYEMMNEFLPIVKCTIE